MEVDPSDQQLFWRQLVQVIQVLSLLGQSHDFRSIFECDFLGESHSYGLPGESQDILRVLVDEIIRINSDELHSDTLGGGDSHLKIFFTLINIHILLLVNGSCVDAVWVNTEEDLAHCDSIVENMEQRLVIRVHWDSILAVLVLCQQLVNDSSECGSFFEGIRAYGSISSLDLGHSSPSSLNNSSEFAIIGVLHANHHVNELVPLENAIFVLILGA